MRDERGHRQGIRYQMSLVAILACLLASTIAFPIQESADREVAPNPAAAAAAAASNRLIQHQQRGQGRHNVGIEQMEGGAVKLSSRFVTFTVSSKAQDPSVPWVFGLVDVRGSMRGTGNFSSSPNLISRPLTTMVAWNDSMLAVPAMPTGDPAVERFPDGSASVHLNFSAEGVRGSVRTQWKLSLSPQSRHVSISVSGTATGNFRAVYLQADFKPRSITGFYEGGVVQMMDRMWACYHPSSDKLLSMYALGPRGKGCIEVLPGHESNANKTFLVSTPSSSGLREMLIGQPSSKRDAWGGFAYAAEEVGPASRTVPQNRGIDPEATFRTSWELWASDREFPPSSVGAVMGDADLERARAVSTGIYGTLAGTLRTHNGSAVEGARVGQISTGIMHPERGYADGFNFFDPDSYLTVQALGLASNAYLDEQVRAVIERTGMFLCPSGGRVGNETCLTDQVPHHFIKDVPVYTAISGERQTGPNVFWTLAALSHGKQTGDLDWLCAYIPTLRKSLRFLKVDPDMGMVKADGSLMVDTFRRVGYTSDTNVAMVHLLREFAAAEGACGEEARTKELLAQAKAVEEAVNTLLWAGDHYVTSVGDRGEVTADFVDYDSNLMAVAFGVAAAGGGSARERAVLKRVDQNPLAISVPTWMSERLYQGEDSRPKGGTGDSICGMGRVAWFNALARRRVGGESERAFFSEHLLGKLSRELLDTVWMNERFGPDGLQQLDRTSHYFEYPAVTALMVVRVLYGYTLSLDAAAVQPWGLKTFQYSMGSTYIVYRSMAGCHIRVPRTGKVRFTIGGMAEEKGPPERYAAAAACVGEEAGKEIIVVTGEGGLLEFEMELVSCSNFAAGESRHFLGDGGARLDSLTGASSYQTVRVRRLEDRGY